jgi:peptidylprolyl isomerase
VPKRKKRELQHLRQESARRRNYQLGNTSPADIYKPGFPMNIFSNVRLFALIGIGVIVSFVVTAILTNQLQGNAADEVEVPSPTATATIDPSVTVSPTAAPKTFSQAETVVDPAKKYTATIKTNKGDIVIELFADRATNTVNSFVFLAQQGFFDGITFHRVSPTFVIQAGDPTGTGSGGPGYATQQEPNEVRNTRGTVSMAKVGTAKEFGSQFFINLKDNPGLDYDQSNPFYPFGEVTDESMAVVDAIGSSPVQGERPNPPITIETIEIEESDS